MKNDGWTGSTEITSSPSNRIADTRMDPRYVFMFMLCLGVVALGCTTTSLSDTCPILNVKQMLPYQNISPFHLVSFSDNLGSDFYRILLNNDTVLLSGIQSGVLASYNSSSIPGATVDILIIEFEDSTRAVNAVSALQDSVSATITSSATVERVTISRNNLSYSSLRITGITNTHGVGFYQEFAFWPVRKYAVMAKLTTPDLGQDSRQEMLQFLDEMARNCAP
jgi:hypothetical protein